MTTTYGTHLTLRLSNIERRYALDGTEQVADFLKTLVRRVGMRVLAGPLVGEEQGGFDKRGFSGVVILYESHAAIHTYPELGEAFVDIFSCSEYSAETVENVLREYYGDFSIVEKTLFDRGTHWDTNIEKEMRSWALAR